MKYINYEHLSLFTQCVICVFGYIVKLRFTHLMKLERPNIFIGAASYHVVTALKHGTLSIIRKRTKPDGQRQQLGTFG